MPLSDESGRKLQAGRIPGIRQPDGASQKTKSSESRRQWVHGTDPRLRYGYGFKKNSKTPLVPVSFYPQPALVCLLASSLGSGIRPFPGGILVGWLETET